MKTNKNLLQLIDEIVNCYADQKNDRYELEWDSIPSWEKNKLTALCIEDDGREMVAIYENEKYKEISDLFINYLNSGEKAFADQIMKSMTEYYKHRLIKLIEKSLEQRWWTYAQENNLKSSIDSNSGCTEWSKQ